MALHVVVSWDISASGERWTTLNESLRGALQPYAWVRPLSTFYIVPIQSEYERTRIQDALVARAKAVSETVHILISPVMVGGQYMGYLPNDMWAKISERTG